MKHIFVIHSPITYLSALGVILKENLDIKDVVIVSECYGSFDFEPIKINLLYKKRSKLRSLTGYSVKKTIYNFLRENIGDCEFISYIPVMHDVAKFVTTHPNCKKFNFLEEGLISYYNYYPMEYQLYFVGGPLLYSSNYLQKVRQQILQITRALMGFTIKLNAIPALYDSYANNPNVKCYGFHKNSFKYSINKNLLDIAEIGRTFNYKKKMNLDNSYIWINDPIIRKDANLSLKEYAKVFNDGYFKLLKDNNVSFSYLKFHPMDTPEEKEMLIQIFKNNNIDYEIIGDNIILEFELLSAHSFNLVGFYSSLLIYGRILGGTSYSVVEKCEYTKNHMRNDVLEYFWEFVNVL